MTATLDPSEFRRTLPELRAFARALTLSNVSADDLVEETLRDAARRESRPSDSASWLFTLLRQRFHASAPGAPAPHGATGDASAFDRAFQRLGALQREALVLLSGALLPAPVAAQICGTDPETLERRADEARQVLGAALIEPGPDTSKAPPPTGPRFGGDASAH